MLGVCLATWPHRTRARGPGGVGACSCPTAVSLNAPGTLCRGCYYYSRYLEDEVAATEIACSKSHSSGALRPRVGLGRPPHSVKVTQHRGGSQPSWGSHKMFVDDDDPRF